MTDKSIFTITHHCNAPRETLFKAWSNKDQLSQWFGPKGAKGSYKHFDFRPGGYAHYKLDYEGFILWGKAEYREIVPNEKIIYVSSFSDEQGGPGIHPLAPTWPREMLTTLTFKDENKNSSVTIEWTPINPTAEEKETFETSHDSMKQGWSGSFEQLDEFLAKNQSNAA